MAPALIALLAFTAPISAQLNEVTLDRLQILVGEWRAVGDGKWGNNSAERKYTWVFGKTFIHDYGRSVYPKQDRNKTGESHETLICIASMFNGKQSSCASSTMNPL